MHVGVVDPGLSGDQCFKVNSLLQGCMDAATSIMSWSTGRFVSDISHGQAAIELPKGVEWPKARQASNLQSISSSDSAGVRTDLCPRKLLSAPPCFPQDRPTKRGVWPKQSSRTCESRSAQSAPNLNRSSLWLEFRVFSARVESRDCESSEHRFGLGLAACKAFA